MFDATFGGLTDPADARGDPGDGQPSPGPRPGADTRAADTRTTGTGGGPADARDAGTGRSGGRPVEFPSLASAAERLSGRDFAELSTMELVELAAAMRRLTLATPPRRSRRTRRVPHGHRVDLRATLRQGPRTGGDPVRLVRNTPRDKPRRLVALCDISGSMQPYARAMLQLLYCAAGGQRAEVFTFATRLTRLTAVLKAATPAVALRRAGQAAPDWAGGTRIAEALREFTDRYGRLGMARGAVLLVISDGWETGDPARLGHEMGSSGSTRARRARGTGRWWAGWPRRGRTATRWSARTTWAP